WIGKGRDENTLKRWLQSLSREQKAAITLVAMDMHRAYWNAVDNTRGLEHAAIVHDPFHVTKLAGQMLDELRREVFFRAGSELRAIGRGKRWLLLRAWERTSDSQKADLQTLLARNRTLARAYQIKEELRDVLHAPDRPAIEIGLQRILRRTARRNVPALRRLHDTLNLRRPLFCDPLSVVRVTHPIARVGARKWPDRDPPGDANRRRVVARRRASREGGRGHRVGVHA